MDVSRYGLSCAVLSRLSEEVRSHEETSHETETSPYSSRWLDDSSTRFLSGRNGIVPVLRFWWFFDFFDFFSRGSGWDFLTGIYRFVVGTKYGIPKYPFWCVTSSTLQPLSTVKSIEEHAIDYRALVHSTCYIYSIILYLLCRCAGEKVCWCLRTL